MITFRIPEMTCGHCASTIARAVASVDKEARIEVSIPEQLVRLVSSAPEADLAEAIQEAGYTPEKLAAAPSPLPRPAGGCCCSSRKPASVDENQAGATRRTSCCG